MQGYARTHFISIIQKHIMSPASTVPVKPVIGTHNGAFHADELVACAMLKQLPEYKNAEIVRTRDVDKLAECSIVVDVGGLFDHTTRRYDHHQRGFNLTLRDFHPSTKWDIKLSSAGLIYVHYGPKVLACITGVPEVDPMIDVYAAFISEIDAIDNGVQETDSVPRYTIHTGLSSRVSMMNPQWNKPDMDESICFTKALAMVETEFVTVVRNFAEVWYPARAVVAEAMKARRSVHPSGAVFLLEQNGCPWKAHVLELERLELEEKSTCTEFDLSDRASVRGRPVYCVYKRNDGSWSAQAVPVSETAQFSSRLPFPEPWRGLRDEELSKAVGLPLCKFVHASGFLAIHQTFEGIMDLACKSLKMAKLINEDDEDCVA
ncbi:unnamed protein product [Echinostoma caproni]|uniref:MYG1 protein n=1 Tax=Echinostoma caproni TaxID=27848 RepID=A0A3P8IFY4_9TREM|nr:unnamed protein product [Echinostoma caproni]